MFNSSFGTQTSWLLPAALVLLAAVLVLTFRAPRTRPHPGGVPPLGRLAARDRGGVQLRPGDHPPLLHGRPGPGDRRAGRDGRGPAVAAPGELVRPERAGRGPGLTAWWAFALLDRTPSWNPWLRGVVLTAGIVAAVGRADRAAARPRRAGACVAVVGIGAGVGRPARLHDRRGGHARLGRHPDRRAQSPAGLGAFAGGRAGGFGRGGAPGGFGGFGSRGTGPWSPRRAAPGRPPFGRGFGAGPAAASPAVRLPRSGRVPGSRPGGAGGGAGGLLNASHARAARWSSVLQADAGHYRWVAAAVGANTAAGYQLGSGEPVMAIGGFNGTDPDPSLATFEKLVAEGKVHYFIAGGGFGGGRAFARSVRRLGAGRSAGRAGDRSSRPDSAAITSWVESHFSAITVGGRDPLRPEPPTG